MTRFALSLLLLALLSRGSFAAPPSVPPAPVVAKPRPLAVAAYQTQLQTLERALSRPSPTVASVKRALPSAGTLRRSDGAAQTVSNAQWNRALGQKRLSRREAKRMRDSVALRRASLASWLRNDYQPADAKRIFAQLQSEGQIRVGPTAFQQWMIDMRQWWRDLIDRIGRWFSGRTPNVPNVKTPQIDPKWLTFFFYSCVFSLLAVVIYFVWKALGGRIGRRVVRSEDRVLEGEDAELLKLPSDELFARATNFAQSQNFREAVRHRFIATLVRFDERALWRYDTRRTNREHIALLRNDAARASLASPLESLARRFDRVRYGNSDVSASDWSRFDSDANALENAPNARAGTNFETTGARA
ncbi:MAG TPA: DUF4129 domain-containing protein [Abditibacteriaceae bacterium]|jgi:hypothetical protein